MHERHVSWCGIWLAGCLASCAGKGAVSRQDNFRRCWPYFLRGYAAMCRVLCFLCMTCFDFFNSFCMSWCHSVVVYKLFSFASCTVTIFNHELLTLGFIRLKQQKLKAQNGNSFQQIASVWVDEFLLFHMGGPNPSSGGDSALRYGSGRRFVWDDSQVSSFQTARTLGDVVEKFKAARTRMEILLMAN